MAPIQAKEHSTIGMTPFQTKEHSTIGMTTNQAKEGLVTFCFRSHFCSSHKPFLQAEVVPAVASVLAQAEVDPHGWYGIAGSRPLLLQPASELV